MSVPFGGVSALVPSRQVSSERIPRSRHPRWLRGVSLLTSATLVWSTVFALPVQLRAQSLSQTAALKAAPKPKIALPSVSHAPLHLSVPANSLKPLSEEEAARAREYEAAHPRQNLSLLNEAADLMRPVTEKEALGWLNEAAAGRLSLSEAALRHVHFGEFRMGAQENPQSAAEHFAKALTLVPAHSPVAQLAKFDLAITLYQTGRYDSAYEAFDELLTDSPSPPTPLPAVRSSLGRGEDASISFDPRTCALWMRHAGACAGYHKERSKAGIVEPGRLDPKCGAAALAVWLRANKTDYSEATVLQNVQVNGRGSRTRDVEVGARSLGLKVWTVGATDEGLKRLPKPLMAYVERDHFIAVTGADAKGITYNCSDCGAWPGGNQHLTWKQWHLLEGTEFTVFARPGSGAEKRMASLLPNPQAGKSSSVLSASLETSSAVKDASVFLLAQATGGCGLPNGATHCTCRIHYSKHCDPVNLSTREEEYSPGADLTIYNPNGPSLSVSRIYNSLSGNVIVNNWEEVGQGWAMNFDLGVYFDGTNRTLVEPNGAAIPLTTTGNAIPTASIPVECNLPAGFPFRIFWKGDAASHTDYYEIDYADRSKIVTKVGVNVTANPPSSGQFYYPVDKQYDRQGNYLQYTYSQETVRGYLIGIPRLDSISDQSGTALLTVHRVNPGSGLTEFKPRPITLISDCYGRSVYYKVETMATSGVNAPPLELTHVSQIVATGTTTPPDAYVYGYSSVTNSIQESVVTLTSVGVPSPANGRGTATTTFEYATDGTMLITAQVDPNSNRSEYSADPLNANRTKVTTKNGSGVVLTSFTVAFNSDMSTTQEFDNYGNVIVNKTFASTAAPTYPSSVQDGNEYAGTVSGSTTYTYDQYGQVLTATSPRGVVTTYTYTADTNFPCGKLTKIQTADSSGNTLGATTLGYDSYGNVNSVTSPKPGVVYANSMNSTQFVTSTYTYDALGNLISMTAPGKDSSTTVTTTLGYTTDTLNGVTTNQAEALGQPLTVTNSLGKVTHLRYDSRGNPLSVTDANGNTVTSAYNLANQPTSATYPATNQTGTGQSKSVTTYLYPGGIALSETLYDENNTAVRAINSGYGAAGELLSVSGSTEPVTYTYDALYRKSSVTDGNSHTTHYYYKQYGTLDAVTYPGYTGATPVYNSASDGWTNVTGKDSVRFPTYDKNGNLLTKTDGRGETTTYTYNDVESRLTNVSYSTVSGVAANPNVTVSYDSFGRTSSVASTVCTLGYSSYDDAGNLLTQTTTYPALPSAHQTFTLSYGYNPNGSRNSLSTPGGTFGYGYDGLGRPTSVTNPASQSFGWGYDDGNRLTSQTTPQTQTTATYNALSELIQLVHKRAGTGGAVLAQYGNLSTSQPMLYDAAGNRTSVTASVPGNTTYGGTTTYGYTAKNELSSETSSRVGGYAQSHVYDTAGNPTTFRNASGQTYNADNQSTASNLSYDGNGNPVIYNHHPLAFDAENRMTSYSPTAIEPPGAGTTTPKPTPAPTPGTRGLRL